MTGTESGTQRLASPGPRTPNPEPSLDPLPPFRELGPAEPGRSLADAAAAPRADSGGHAADHRRARAGQALVRSPRVDRCGRRGSAGWLRPPWVWPRMGPPPYLLQPKG